MYFRVFSGACAAKPGRLAGLISAISLAFLGWSTAAAPVITGVSPTAGEPGTPVQITGTDLGTTLDVQFGQAPSIFSVISANLVIATVPLDATSDPITLTAGTGITRTTGRFLVSPRIDEIDPGRAPIGGTVSIFGANFEGATAVRFNGTNAQFSVTSPTLLRAVVPVGATSGPVSVVSPIGIARSDFDFTVAGNEPFVTSFSPARGAPGTAVTIQGLNFRGITAVRFAGTNAAFTVPSATQIRVTVPPSAATGFITISNGLGVGTSPEPFIVTTAPIIDEFAPIGGAAGTDVVINGANFLGTTSVKFGSKAAAFSVTAGTQLHATVPAGATNGPITITTPQGTGTSQAPFIASGAPIIGEFSPTSGPPGTQVAINGLNFTGTRAVKLNGTNVPKFTVTAPTQIIVPIPANGSSGPFTITNAAGSTTSFGSFLVRTGKPIVTSFDPPAGPARTTVIIEGLDLARATAVRFNGAPAVFSAVADTQISTLVPESATSGPISVTTPTGTVTTSNRFVVAPGISSFTPTSGTAGTTVQIKGTNFADLLAVRVRNVPVPFEVVSSNQVAAVIPDTAITGPVNLISAAGIVGSTNQFLVQPTIRGFTPISGQAGTPVTISGTGFADVTAVRFGQVNAIAVTVNSSTQLVAVVPGGAVTGLITIQTASGSAQSTSAFIVGAAADLGLTLVQSTNAVLENQLLLYTVTVTNRGPASATGVILSNVLPADVVITSATNSSGALTRTNSTVSLALGTLTNGASATLKISALPTAAGTITNLATVAGRETDPDPANNQASLAAAVAPNGAVVDIQEVAGGNLRISWPASAGEFVVEFAESLASHTAWQNLGIAPTTAGNERSVTVPLAGKGRFYRLRR